MVSRMTASHAANMSARPLNPDTDNTMPSPTRPQLDLVAELCASIGQSTDPENVVHRALVVAVVRQSGRTLRAAIASLRDAANHEDAEARRRVEAMRDGEPAVIELEHAARHAASAATLRRVTLRTEGA